MAAAHGCEQNLLHVNTYLKEESAKKKFIFSFSPTFSFPVDVRMKACFSGQSVAWGGAQEGNQ